MNTATVAFVVIDALMLAAVLAILRRDARQARADEEDRGDVSTEKPCCARAERLPARLNGEVSSKR